MPSIALILIVVGCAEDPVQPLVDQFPVMPAHLPTMPYPVGNTITPAKVDLGRHLYFDQRLSSEGTIACASCHRPEKSFSDAPNQVSMGVLGARGQRNAPMIVNAGYRKVMFWDGRAGTLEEQAMGAFLNSTEMDADTIAVAALLRSDAYRSKWLDAFGDTLVSMTRAMQAIATFERTIVSANSRYDRFNRGETQALSEQERQGMQLFFSSRTMCSSCHGGNDFTDDQYHNVGLFHHYFDRGRYNVTKDPLDEGKFKTPTLRNIALSSPYMATGDSEKGLMLTLEQVVDHYNDGGTPFPNKDPRVKKLGLKDPEKAALVAFMKALTDSSVLTNPAWQKP
ncbi:MAG: hypothetical protein NTX15_00700 [Candidatus Kapabacteria bacterium]|nr:hypothetical protein [Candidatus Kapabacteria bacterium]